MNKSTRASTAGPRNILCVLGLVVVFCVPTHVPAASQTPPSPTSAVPVDGSYFRTPDRLISFADFLYDRQDYARAATEYQRYLFSGEATHVDYARFRVGLCYLNMGDPAGAVELFRSATINADASQRRDSAATAWAAAALLADTFHDQHQFEPTFQVASQFVGHQAAQTRLNRFAVLHRLEQFQWSLAEPLLVDAADDDSTLYRLLARGQTLPHRSPALAMALSAVVPGAGKVYAGRPSDGLMSFILIGGQAWLSIEGFRDHGVKSFKGWFFGIVGFSFYAGNVYGSRVAVKLYNQKHVDIFSSEIRTHISIAARL